MKYTAIKTYKDIEAFLDGDNTTFKKLLFSFSFLILQFLKKFRNFITLYNKIYVGDTCMYIFRNIQLRTALT